MVAVLIAAIHTSFRPRVQPEIVLVKGSYIPIEPRKHVASQSGKFELYLPSERETSTTFVISNLMDGGAYYPEIHWRKTSPAVFMWDESDCVWGWTDETEVMSWSRSTTGQWEEVKGRAIPSEVLKRIQELKGNFKRTAKE